MAFRPVKLLDREGLLEYAARALSTRGLSLGELRQRLDRRASCKDDVAEVLGKLKENGFLNDQRLADSIAGWRRDNQGLGKTRVLRDLLTRRIASAVAKRAVDAAYSTVDEPTLIEQFLARKYRNKNLGEILRDPKQLASAYRRLRTAGFGSGNSIRVLKRYAAEAETLEDSTEELEEQQP